MGKVFQISIYSILLILVFLVFGTMLKSCGSSAVDKITDTADEVTENIQNAGGEVVAKAESVMEDVAEEFEGDDIDFSSTENESKSYGDDSKSDNDSDSPSYVQEDAPVYNPPEDVVKEPTKKVVEEKKPAKKSTSSSSSNSSSSRGNYLLITGNYSQENNAKAMVKKLKNKGFPNAESIIFEGSRYYTVIAGKYSSMSTANSAKRDLGGIDAYVQKKRL